jgi:hypothetical protein
MSGNNSKVVEVEFLPKQTVLDIQPSEIFKKFMGRQEFHSPEMNGLAC